MRRKAKWLGYCSTKSAADADFERLALDLGTNLGIVVCPASLVRDLASPTLAEESAHLPDVIRPEGSDETIEAAEASLDNCKTTKVEAKVVHDALLEVRNKFPARGEDAFVVIIKVGLEETGSAAVSEYVVTEDGGVARGRGSS